LLLNKMSDTERWKKPEIFSLTISKHSTLYLKQSLAPTS
jgi:hypothetical protein